MCTPYFWVLTSLVAALVTAATVPTAAQGDVGLAAGVRVGYPWGLSVKAFVTDEVALEGIAGFQPFWGSPYRATDLRLGGFYHYDLELREDGLEPLQLMFGASAGLRFWRYDDDFFFGPGDRDGVADVTLGLRAHVGAQYAFDDLPLELTFDVGPGLGFGDLWINRFLFHSSAGVRYVLTWR